MSEKDINNELSAQQDLSVQNTQDAQQAVCAADEYGIFSFLADEPIFAVEKVNHAESIQDNAEIISEPGKREIVLTQRDTSSVYDLIYFFGLQIIRRVRKIGKAFLHLFRTPLHVISVFAGLVFILFDKVLLKSLRNFGNDLRHLSTDAKQRGKKEGNVFQRHPKTVRTLLNTAMPLAAFVILVLTVNYFTSATYALEVVLENETESYSLGYISDESVFIEAQSIVKDRIDSGAAEEEGNRISEPVYKIARVQLNELSDADTISEKLIENSDTKLTNACGVYIDGEFICSIKNETDARSVFNSILEDAEIKYGVDKNSGTSFADFVEEIEFVQGLYSDDKEKMWEASGLLDTLRNEKKQAARYYTVKDGDTPSEIAQANDLSTSQLKALNPSVNFDVFKTGTQLLISSEVNFVRVKIMKVIEKVEEIPFSVETVDAPNLFKGDKRTIRNGVKGSDKVTYLVTYVDGVQDDIEEIDRITISEPVSKKVQVGTKATSVSGGKYEVVSGSKMVWPVSGLYTITSYYGNRSRGWHNGIDISGGGASGKLVLAAESGTVELVKFSNKSYGNQVVINHGNGLKTRYAHMLDGSISVSVGQKVSRGQAIGRVGNTGNSTGPHLHFEVIVNGNCVNPLPYIR